MDERMNERMDERMNEQMEGANGQTDKSNL